jgi:hypothetical protein
MRFASIFLALLLLAGQAWAGPDYVAGPVGFPGHGLVNIQTFCASGCSATGGTYTKTTGTNQVIIEVVGSGGGSGGCGATGSTTACVGGSAASGSYAKVLYTSGFSGITMTVGAAGAAGSATPTLGGTGGVVSAGSLISCPGGIGGPVGNTVALTVYAAVVAGAAAPSGCTITGGTTILSVAGQAADYGSGAAVASGTQYPGRGGSNPLGTGPAAPLCPSAVFVGAPGSGKGWGAGGSCSDASQSATTGLAGGPGIIIVYEYN